VPQMTHPRRALIYSQETIPIIWETVQWNGFTGPLAGKCGNTWFPTGGAPDYPYPNFIPDSLAQPYTGYGGDGDTNCIGLTTGDPTLLSALQGGSSVGAILAPRAFHPNMADRVDFSVLANYWFCGNPFPLPWAGGNRGLRLKVTAAFPYVHVPYINGLIDTQGTVFSYMVAQISNINDGKLIEICPRLMQNQFPQGSDQNGGYEWDFGPGDQVSYDGGSGAAILFPECAAGNAWGQSGGTGTFTIGASPSVKTYQWTMSAAQLSAGIQAINLSPRVPRHDFDTNPANWQLRLVNLDMEAWAPAGADIRLGLSFNTFQAYTMKDDE
jgi:hypothetical protein